MTVTSLEILGSDGEKFPMLTLERTRDALAAYCAVRWPTTRRKAVAKEWDLTPDQARSVCEGSASQATIDQIWAHPRARWAVVIPVFSALIGPIEDFIQSQRVQHATNARRSGALVRDLRALPRLSDTVPGRADHVADSAALRRGARRG